jgi:hypothetical protein
MPTQNSFVITDEITEPKKIAFYFDSKAWVTMVPAADGSFDIVLGEGVTLTEAAARFLEVVRSLSSGPPCEIK